MFCLAPLMLIGYALTIQTPAHHTPNVNAPVMEIQSCDEGLGAHFKMSGAGIYAPGIQYGYKKAWEHWSITVQPFGGLTFLDHAIGESQKRFEVGFQFLVGYDSARLGVEYWHMSNGYMSYPNVGLDMIVIQSGWRF